MKKNIVTAILAFSVVFSLWQIPSVPRTIRGGLLNLGVLHYGDPRECANQTIEQVSEFLQDDMTNTIPYDFDNQNCVSYSLLLSNNAGRCSLKAVPVRVMFTDGTGHLMLLFNTKDAGVVFVEPQNDSLLPPSKLKPGSTYFGRVVKSVDVADFTWLSFEDYMAGF